jgi:hypothetical protein
MYIQSDFIIDYEIVTITVGPFFHFGINSKCTKKKPQSTFDKHILQLIQFRDFRVGPLVIDIHIDGVVKILNVCTVLTTALNFVPLLFQGH